MIISQCRWKYQLAVKYIMMELQLVGQQFVSENFFDDRRLSRRLKMSYDRFLHFLST